MQKIPISSDLFRLVLLIIGSLLAYLTLYIPIPNYKIMMVRFMGVALLNFLFYLKAIKLITTPKDTSSTTHKAQLLAIIISGILFRLVLLPIDPFTSTDIYRYVWDGRVQVAGINPYRYAPTAPELAHLRDSEIYPNINNSSLPTIYPPLAEAGFFIAYKLVGGILGIKLLALIADLAAMLILLRLLTKHKLAPAQYLLIYWWSPLIVLEFFVSTHVDALGIPLVALFLFYMHEEKLNHAAVAFAGAVLIKLLPLAFLPAIVWKLGLKRSVPFLALSGLIIVLGYLPFLTIGTDVFFSLLTYMRHWSYNSSCHDLIRLVVSDGFIARIICYLAIIIWALVATLRSDQMLKAMFWTLVGLYLFFPTVFPWYLSWIVPFTIFNRSWAMFLFLGLVPISYWLQAGYDDPYIWLEGPIVRIIEYAPLFFMILSQLKNRPTDQQQPIKNPAKEK